MTIKAKLTTFDATMIVVSLIIGIGIFRTPAMVAAAAKTPAALLRRLGPRRPDQPHRRPDLRRDRRPLRQAGQLLQGRGRELQLRPGLHAQLDQRRHPQRGRRGRRRPDRGRIPDAHRLPGRRPDDGDRPGHGRRPHPRPPGHQLPRHQDRRLGPERPEHPQGGHDRHPGRGGLPVQEGPRRPGRPAARPALVPRPRRRLHLRLLRLRRLPEHHQLRRRRPRRPAQRPPGRLLRHPHRPGLLPDHQRRLRQGPRRPRHRRGQARRRRDGPGHPGRDRASWSSRWPSSSRPWVSSTSP